jgi:hypothetical protein
LRGDNSPLTHSKKVFKKRKKFQKTIDKREVLWYNNIRKGEGTIRVPPKLKERKRKRKMTATKKTIRKITELFNIDITAIKTESELLSAIDYFVDEVWFDEDTEADVIETINGDVLCCIKNENDEIVEIYFE